MVRASSEYTISASVSPSLWQRPLLASTMISVIFLVTGRQPPGLGDMEPGAFFGDASRAKGENGSLPSQQRSSTQTPTPRETGPGPGCAHVRALGFRLLSLGSCSVSVL